MRVNMLNIKLFKNQLDYTMSGQHAILLIPYQI